MSKYLNIAAFTAALMVTSVAMAQFNTEQGGGGVDTQVSIKQTGPGKAELTFTDVKIVYLNQDPKIEGVNSKPDVSGKGPVWVVDLKKAPKEATQGTEVYVTGVGSVGWALDAGGRIDQTKSVHTALAESYTVPVSIGGPGGCTGFTFVPAKNGVKIGGEHLWISHPGNASFLFQNANGETDMVTLLCKSKSQDGIITAATAEEAAAWAPTYLRITAATQARVAAGKK